MNSAMMASLAADASMLMQNMQHLSIIGGQFFAKPPKIEFVPDDCFPASYRLWDDTVQVSRSFFSEPRASQKTIMSHEIHHRAAGLTGGRPAFDFCGWLHEGMSELYAQRHHRQLALGAPRSVVYLQETTVSFWIERQVGNPSLFGAAFLSGDFSTIARIIDSNLGGGTFSRWISSSPYDIAKEVLKLSNNIGEAADDPIAQELLRAWESHDKREEATRIGLELCVKLEQEGSSLAYAPILAWNLPAYVEMLEGQQEEEMALLMGRRPRGRKGF